MKRRDFERLALTYGGVPEKWPPEYRRRAVRFLARAPDVSRVLTSVRALDSALFAQQRKISDLRIARLRKQILEQTRSEQLVRFPGMINRLWRGWLLARRLLQTRVAAVLVAGAIIMLGIAWVMQAQRSQSDLSRALAEQTDVLTTIVVSRLLDLLESV